MRTDVEKHQRTDEQIHLLSELISLGGLKVNEHTNPGGEMFHEKSVRSNEQSTSEVKREENI